MLDCRYVKEFLDLLQQNNQIASFDLLKKNSLWNLLYHL